MRSMKGKGDRMLQWEGERLLGPHQGVEGWKRGTGSSHTEPGGALLVSSLRGKPPVESIPGQVFLGCSPSPRALWGSRKQRAGLGEHLSGPTLRTVPRSSQSQATLPFLALGKGEMQPHLQSHHFGLPHVALVPLFSAWLSCARASPKLEMVKSKQFAARSRARSGGESRNAGRRGRSDSREWLFGTAIVGGAESDSDSLWDANHLRQSH